MERFNCLYLKKNEFGGLIFSEAIEYALGSIGNLAGANLLDAGCGNGEMSIFFAKCNANVTGVDINQERLENAHQKSRVNGVSDRCKFLKASAENMAMIPSECFDIVFSMSTIQYMDRQKAIGEYLRVLRKGGSLVLIENLPDNPFIKLYRGFKKLTARSKKSKDYIRSVKGYLTFEEIEDLNEHFEIVRQKQFHLLNVLAVFSFSKRIRFFKLMKVLLIWADNFIMSAIPGSEKFCWITTVVYVRKK